jgi:hypothetical protein
MRILEPVTFCERIGARAELRLTREHSLGRVFPVGREMTRPTTVSITDRWRGHECVAEAFDTTFNVLLLLYLRKL